MNICGYTSHWRHDARAIIEGGWARFLPFKPLAYKHKHSVDILKITTLKNANQKIGNLSTKWIIISVNYRKDNVRGCERR